MGRPTINMKIQVGLNIIYSDEREQNYGYSYSSSESQLWHNVLWKTRAAGLMDPLCADLTLNPLLTRLAVSTGLHTHKTIMFILFVFFWLWRRLLGFFPFPSTLAIVLFLGEFFYQSPFNWRVGQNRRFSPFSFSATFLPCRRFWERLYFKRAHSKNRASVRSVWWWIWTWSSGIRWCNRDRAWCCWGCRRARPTGSRQESRAGSCGGCWHWRTWTRGSRYRAAASRDRLALWMWTICHLTWQEISFVKNAWVQGIYPRHPESTHYVLRCNGLRECCRHDL